MTTTSAVGWIRMKFGTRLGLIQFFFFKWIFVVVVRDHVSQKVKCTRRVTRVLIQPLFSY